MQNCLCSSAAYSLLTPFILLVSPLPSFFAADAHPLPLLLPIFPLLPPPPHHLPLLPLPPSFPCSSHTSLRRRTHCIGIGPSAMPGITAVVTPGLLVAVFLGAAITLITITPLHRDAWHAITAAEDVSWLAWQGVVIFPNGRGHESSQACQQHWCLVHGLCSLACC
ncbi:unnamed protein product [Closterium sp. Yama58-4]|nr:unnamed protein product [Closterium sp. Yama58-4]